MQLVLIRDNRFVDGRCTQKDIREIQKDIIIHYSTKKMMFINN